MIGPVVGILEIEIQLHGGRIGRPRPDGGPVGVAKTVLGGCKAVGYA